MCDWSGKNGDKSGKSQGNLISCVSGNPVYCLVVSMSASHAVGRGFASRPGHTKDQYKNGTYYLPALYSGV